MTAQGEDILAWLDAAIGKREETARAVGMDCFGIQTRAWGSTNLVEFSGVQRFVGPELDLELAQHVVLHDPTSVLRRCAADRKLLELHGGRGHACPSYDYDGDLDEYARFYNHEVCPVVQHLADGYGWTAGQTPPIEGDQVT